MERVPQGQFENTFPRSRGRNANFLNSRIPSRVNWDTCAGRIGRHGYCSSFSIGRWCPRSFPALSFISRVISPADVALVCHASRKPAPRPTLPRGILKLCPFSSTRSKSRRDFRSFPLKRKERNLFDRIIRPYIYICIGVPSTVRRSSANYRYRSRVEHSLNDVLDSGAVPLVVRVVNDRT